jgi:sugar lactone lactonase YvrE
MATWTKRSLAVSALALCACNASKPVEDNISALHAASSELRRPAPTNDPREPQLASQIPIGELETVATFDRAMPTGVAVSHAGRIFINFPRWGDDVPFTVGELKNGVTSAYPDANFNRIPPAGHLETGLVSVQSVVIDALDRLWILDTGSIKMQHTELGGPKLVGVDLGSNQIFTTIVFPRTVALATSYLNDVRFDLTRGKSGYAFITDSSPEGPNGIVVVDLGSGKSWRKLNDHPSTKPDRAFLPIVEGRVLAQREPGKPAKPFASGADGIAISNDGKTLYYCPLSSRHLYSVPTDALSSEAMPDAAVARLVKDLGEKGASDGLESDAQGRLYATNTEANAILRRNVDGSFDTLVADPRVLWPDTMALATDGHLYFTVNQLDRQPRFHEGKDLRQKPYVLFRIKVDGQPVLLKK